MKLQYQEEWSIGNLKRRVNQVDPNQDLTTNPEKVYRIETVGNNLADHKTVKIKYHMNKLKETPQFIQTRDWAKVTSDSLMK